MKIIETKALKIPEIKVIKFSRFSDNRGYFTETYRKDNFKEIDFLKDLEFTQINESYSKAGTFRGFHFQWNPYMGKLVRCIHGHLIDFALDIRKDSETFGKIIAYDIESKTDDTESDWIWIPPGFAHGALLIEDSVIEYLCTGSYNPDCEFGISPLANDIDWSLCSPVLKAKFDQIVPHTEFISDKDKNAANLNEWVNDNRSNNFLI